MGDLQLSPTKDTSEGPLKTFMAMKGHRLLIKLLLLIEVRFQHIQTKNVSPAYHVRKLCSVQCSRSCLLHIGELKFFVTLVLALRGENSQAINNIVSEQWFLVLLGLL